MMQQNKVVKTVTGIALTFFLISEIVAILTLLLPIMISGTLSEQFTTLANLYWPRLVIVATIISLYVYARKNNWRLCDFYKDQVICLATGVLLVFSGVFGLVDKLRVLISVASMNDVLLQDLNILTRNAPIGEDSVIHLAFAFCQVAIGVYLIKFYKEKMLQNGNATK